MTSLTRTIDETMVRIGAEPRDALLDTLAAFETLGLSPCERVSAIATALAAAARLHHARHSMRFFDAIQIWSLEALAERAADAIVATSDGGDFPEVLEAVARAASLIENGLRAMLRALARADIALQDRVVAELALFTRLLAAHDIPTILKTIWAASEDVHRAANDPAHLVLVALGEPEDEPQPADAADDTTRARRLVDLRVVAAQGCA